MDIVCFSKDFFEASTCNHHVLQTLARQGHRVLWLNSIATRNPDVGSARDLKKIVRKLELFLQGPQRHGDNLWVFTPIVLPFPHQSWATDVNRRILQATIWALRRRIGMRQFQLWTFIPNLADYVGHLGESAVVYYVTDEWSLFSYVDTERTLAAEARLCQRADIIFAVCHELQERKRRFNPHTFLSPHGVDHDLFARALDPSLALPPDLASIPGPRIGFYGTLHDWIDQPILEAIATRHPDWSLILIGPRHVDMPGLAGRDNVYFLGPKPKDELPAYCKGFEVGIIPYRDEERMKFVNPLKLREYFSAGLPVVSTSVPEVVRFGDRVAIADTPEDFVAQIEALLERDDDAQRRARSEAMRTETWDHKVKRLVRYVGDVLAGVPPEPPPSSTPRPRA
ncbi:MAG: glycosyltransferase [Myxococcota bacterium]